jgi:hypothetical protein
MSSATAGNVLGCSYRVTCSEQAYFASSGTLLVLQLHQNLIYPSAGRLTALACFLSLKVLTLTCAEVDEA